MRRQERVDYCNNPTCLKFAPSCMVMKSTRQRRICSIRAEFFLKKTCCGAGTLGFGAFDGTGGAVTTQIRRTVPAQDFGPRTPASPPQIFSARIFRHAVLAPVPRPGAKPGCQVEVPSRGAKPGCRTWATLFGFFFGAHFGPRGTGLPLTRVYRACARVLPSGWRPEGRRQGLGGGSGGGPAGKKSTCEIEKSGTRPEPFPGERVLLS